VSLSEANKNVDAKNKEEEKGGNPRHFFVGVYISLYIIRSEPMSRQCLQILGTNLGTLEQQLDKSKKEQLALQMEVRTLTQQQITEIEKVRTLTQQRDTELAKSTALRRKSTRYHRERDVYRYRLIEEKQRAASEQQRAILGNQMLIGHIKRGQSKNPADLVGDGTAVDAVDDEGGGLCMSGQGWSEEVLDELKTLFQRGPRWFLTTQCEDDEDEVLVFGQFDLTAGPWKIKGNDGKRYSAHQVLRYFDH
jgi:hypothetical protein